jgi:cob(I)alamin adenosyltransferase
MYTKKGDHGESTLSNGKKLLKNNPYFDALGSLDELNSHIGFVTQ